MARQSKQLLLYVRTTTTYPPQIIHSYSGVQLRYTLLSWSCADHVVLIYGEEGEEEWVSGRRWRRREDSGSGGAETEGGAGGGRGAWGILHGGAGRAVPLPDRAAGVPAVGPAAAPAAAAPAAAGPRRAHGRPAGAGVRAVRRPEQHRLAVLVKIEDNDACTRASLRVCFGVFLLLLASF